MFVSFGKVIVDSCLANIHSYSSLFIHNLILLFLMGHLNSIISGLLYLGVVPDSSMDTAALELRRTHSPVLCGLEFSFYRRLGSIPGIGKPETVNPIWPTAYFYQ